MWRLIQYVCAGLLILILLGVGKSIAIGRFELAGAIGGLIGCLMLIGGFLESKERADKKVAREKYIDSMMEDDPNSKKR